ncbi:MAG: dihydroorotate dehydrogenase electron transfer subunit, partial [Actinobacteria bacterium]|nr:dihydroorotate dehydrogenase electron transfer subunit [Actinomycetota bacterium]
MELFKGEVVSAEKYGEGFYRLDIFSPCVCRNAMPGQFISVKCRPDYVFDPFLRRPFSIYDIEKKFNVFSILYLVRGKGTEFLSSVKKGDILDLAGPFGRGIEIDKVGGHYKGFLLVGGGAGVAPLYLLAKNLVSSGHNVLFISGFKNSNFARWERDLIDLKVNYKIFTEDGSWGERGLVTDFIERNVKNYKEYKLYCCGPKEMLKAIQEILRGKKIQAEALLEERVGCSVGVCMGCVVRIRSDGGFTYKTLCRDGPC